MKETDGKMMTAWCDQTTSSVFFYIISFNWRIMRRKKKSWWYLASYILSWTAWGKIYYSTCWQSPSLQSHMTFQKWKAQFWGREGLKEWKFLWHFLWTRCKICYIKARFNCKKNEWKWVPLRREDQMLNGKGNKKFPFF